MQITLEQWQTLVAVVDQGGYARAAEALNKSQSAVSYAIQRLEERLGIAVFRIEGRKATLTDAGKALYRQAQSLLESARLTEELARHYSSGSEALIRLAVDIITPEMPILCALSRYAEAFPFVRIELLESVLSGTDEALLRGEAEIVVNGRVPPGFSGDPLLRMRFIAVAHPDHPLHQLGRPLTHEDLRQHRQLVIRDSGSRKLDAGWLGADQRWTVSHISTSIDCACRGLGFAWYPALKIQRQIQQGLLKPLPLESGAERYVDLYLILRDAHLASPGVKHLASLIREEAKKVDIMR
ncbi:Transcriptional regulator, LysR family [Marinobacterium lacunae]|uniref:Transcriptional regulator, LysR family n=1 Tax=Marinobacterium lacunae TaxID=1232683 RepID=A0A081FZN5_9GAMM|nr:LysR family transcriptional regulator [Marinobacterium lacunae]KEA63990.1 Transcriptional regulator, LysR family [Marinobacterium lacunae]